ncbi:MAG: glutamine-hydrolyzing carbamoyl-phosphate synthase small subunit [Bacteriovoracaceae bacterium]
MRKCKLWLADGTVFAGTSFGHDLTLNHSFGEVVFNTSMVGYQEIMTDPSYYGQILTMTYPMIGNYGISREDFESLKPVIKGMVVREYCEEPSNFRQKGSLAHFLKEFKIPAISGIDTRKLTKILRSKGNMKGVLTNETVSIDEAKEYLKMELPRDQVKQVSTKTPFHYQNHGERIVMLDFGFKAAILRHLTERNCEVIVLPYNATPADVRKYHPDGILLSNGPGDPKDVAEAIQTVKTLQAEYPIMGICLGHQIFALANGADTYKMTYGHRGANHPVKDLFTGKTYLTSQNHGYAVDQDSMLRTELETTQINLNDSTIEGIRHKHLPSFSVQYHPEAAAGPQDTAFLFDQFLTTVKNHKNNTRGLYA